MKYQAICLLSINGTPRFITPFHTLKKSAKGQTAISCKLKIIKQQYYFVQYMGIWVTLKQRNFQL